MADSLRTTKVLMQVGAAYAYKSWHDLDLAFAAFCWLHIVLDANVFLAVIACCAHSGFCYGLTTTDIMYVFDQDNETI